MSYKDSLLELAGDRLDPLTTAKAVSAEEWAAFLAIRATRANRRQSGQSGAGVVASYRI